MDEFRGKGEVKLLWHTLVELYLWHAFPKSALITDEQAWVHLSRLKEWVDEALGILEGEPPTE